MDAVHNKLRGSPISVRIQIPEKSSGWRDEEYHKAFVEKKKKRSFTMGRTAIKVE